MSKPTIDQFTHRRAEACAKTQTPVKQPTVKRRPWIGIRISFLFSYALFFELLNQRWARLRNAFVIRSREVAELLVEPRASSRRA